MSAPAKSPAAGEAAHTPTPYVVKSESHGNGAYAIVSTGGGGFPSDLFVALIVNGATPQDDGGAANAAFIVRACNSHAALVEALETVKTRLIDRQGVLSTHDQMQISAVLAAAKHGGAS